MQLFYMGKGFLDITVNDPEVRVHPEGKGMYIAIQVEEGPKYKLGKTVRFVITVLSQPFLDIRILVFEPDVFHPW